MTIAQNLGAFAASPIDADERIERFVRFSLFDWATVGLAGRNEPVSRAAREMAMSAAASPDGATLLGGGQVTASAAALANGATSHALDYDDTHFGHIGHPSVAIVPATLAMAETRKADGKIFLDALSVGLETACRIGAWLGRSHYEVGFHQTGTSGAFGAAAAAGRILRLDEDRMMQALCLTATRAAGLKSQFGTMGKPLNAGFAAEVGVTCALLAEAGAQSTPDAIEGPQGFGPTHAGVADDAAFDTLGREWLFPGISYKFHACCHGLHAMLEAARSLTIEGLNASDVEAVAIRTHPRWLAVCNQPEPQTGLQAKFSYRLTAAMALAGIDTAALDVYNDETCARADLVALRDRVTVIPDDALSDTEAHLTVTMKAGEQQTAHHDILSKTEPDAIERRLRHKSSALLGDRDASDLWETVAKIDGPNGLSALIGQIGMSAS
ncbi:MmgE/PrpD family protein [Notoacmeibacter sp. MSK16QG-6]|uniref:MmgE/PrpD family protein n=1 Tax=Notoacmeibacter sp. MSK16QG-6 TaxID=2957982 RepID=UPI00209C89A1|nr:MmgE/PrpD family protein [Notoacmeibacter sp. MSK16QG-6]MCP1198280.1 MmgE/PrpD family protein [Notoacmeibacter sp. MSK16QG-6]